MSRTDERRVPRGPWPEVCAHVWSRSLCAATKPAVVDACGVVADERETVRRQCIVCGDNALALRLAEEMVRRYRLAATVRPPSEGSRAEPRRAAGSDHIDNRGMGECAVQECGTAEQTTDRS